MSQVVNTNVDRLRDIKVNGLDLTELIVGCHLHNFLREKCDKWRKGDKFCAKTTKTSVGFLADYLGERWPQKTQGGTHRQELISPSPSMKN